ncbi:MAG: cysteine--tRNA ligase [Nitrospinae bacterium]|nr:cysteine--tRNA ligase [Nitrospinota bacterium]
MSLKIHNSLTRQKETFQPIKEGKVRMYVCGVTVYDFCHIGHARSGIVFDVIYRYFKHIQKTGGLEEVIYVRNFTDVDDKIINKANQDGKTCREISEKYIEEFYRDMDALGLLKPDVEPKATDHIPEMISIIEKLIEKDHAYQAGNDVYFDINSFSPYGKLSGKTVEDLLAGARVAVDEKKKDPGDFALWKGSKPGEPEWDSPWGKGRPGWHIECSAMGQKYLGEYFDIHGGGKDLIFPHHENEIAQSHAATGKVPVKYWIHNGFVDINKEKMSKSLGNFFTIREVLKEVNPETLRFFLLSSHYRSGIDFSEQVLKDARIGVERFYRTLQDLMSLQTKGGSEREQNDPRLELILSTHKRFFEEMDDDFNTAAAIGRLFEWVRAVNSLLTENPSLLLANRDKILQDFRDMSFVLGVFQQDPGRHFEKETEARLAKLNMDRREIARLIDERAKARKNKDWAGSDAIRDQLAAKGIVLEDKPDGTVWKFQ